MYSEDDIFNYSKGNDNTHDLNYLNKKQLINLENDKSLSISSDYDDISNQHSIMNTHRQINPLKISQNILVEKIDSNFDIKYPNKFYIGSSPISSTNKKERIIGKNDDLLKFISDASGKDNKCLNIILFLLFLNIILQFSLIFKLDK